MMLSQAEHGSGSSGRGWNLQGWQLLLQGPSAPHFCFA